MEEFITADLYISKIVSIYYLETFDWKRPLPYPRYTNGIVLVKQGSVEYRFEDTTIVAKKGGVLVFPKNVIYSGIKLTKKDEYDAFYVLDFEIASEGCTLDNFPLPLYFTVSYYEQIEQLFLNIIDIWNKKELCYMLKCKSYVYELLNYLIADYSKGFIKSGQLFQISKIIDYINMNYCNPSLSIQEICQRFFLSDTHIRRLFRKAFSQSPLEYIQSLRLKKAKKLLLETGSSLEQIAYMCGFSSGSYFSRLFKKQNGISPSYYRANKWQI